MLDHSKYEILVVDDDESVRSSLVMLLEYSGYRVSTAIHGFDALLQLKRSVPAIVLSDLNMPEMSGFEFLSVVRRRFPQISVIAMSGAYHSGDSVPGGVIADAFYGKGLGTPDVLLEDHRRPDTNFRNACRGPSERIRSRLDSPERQ